MKNVFQIGTLTGIGGGVAVYIRSIVNHKIDNNIHYFIGTISKNETILKDYKCTDNIYFDIRYNLITLPYKIISLARIIKKNEINTLHAHTQRAGLLAALIKVLLPYVKVIYTPHGLRHTQLSGTKAVFHKMIEGFILKHIDTVTTITDFESSDLDKYINKIKRIHTVIDLNNSNSCNSIKTKYKISENKKIIAMIGSMNDRKQPLLFYEIAKILLANRNDIVFFWIGDGSLRSQIEEQIINDKLTESFIITGQIDRHLLFSYLNEISILLFTSKQEGLPLTILEAIYAGVIVISNSYMNVNEIIVNGYNGFLFKYNNSESAIEILNYALDNYEKLEDIRNNSKVFIKKHTDITNFVKSYETIYI